MTLALGRRAPKNAPALLFAHLSTGIVPPHPAASDNLAALSEWDMLGNDQYGDCVAVTWANFRRLVTTALTGHEEYPNLDQVIEFYKTQNPDFDPNGSSNTNGPESTADGGMDIQTALEYLVKHGGPDGVKAVAFAKVDHTDIEQVKAANAIFGGVWTGINVLDINEHEFDKGVPWDWSDSANNLGGHSVLSGGYLGKITDDVTFITWASETAFTDAYLRKGVEEMWVVIWPEHLKDKTFLQGVDLAALADDYKALTGRTLPIPVPVVTPPAPTPTPSPTPTPTPEHHFPRDIVEQWANAKHSGLAAKVAKALRDWLAAHPEA